MQAPSGVELLLGIETSGEATGLALVRDGRALGRVVEPTGAHHNETLLGLLDKLFREAACLPTEISGIGVSLGPGMFTSLRVGLAVAKAVALSGEVRLCGIDTRDALAETVLRSAPDPQLDTILVLIDARKGEVCAALYRGAERISEPGLLHPRELAGIPGRQLLVAGSGIRPYRSLLETALGARSVFLDIEYPEPEVVAELAGRRFRQGLADDADHLAPVYLRRTDAELRRVGTAPGMTPDPGGPA